MSDYMGQLMRFYHINFDRNTHAQLFIGVTGLDFGLSLQIRPYLILASSEGSGKSVLDPSLLAYAISEGSGKSVLDPSLLAYAISIKIS